MDSRVKPGHDRRRRRAGKAKRAQHQHLTYRGGHGARAFAQPAIFTIFAASPRLLVVGADQFFVIGRTPGESVASRLGKKMQEPAVAAMRKRAENVTRAVW